MNSIIALDVGERRVGVAIANRVAKMAHPLTTLENNDVFWKELQAIITKESADLIVMGLPRNLSGDDTNQTRYVRDFALKLDGVPVIFQDEALTSVKAEAELKSRGKAYTKGDIDALSATYILEDYLIQHGSTL